ncbi:MAG: transcriptional repressor [Oscillospiraceae bacterium]|nr:transcriptional repressor [Oscillospiraceae bacterium]
MEVTRKHSKKRDAILQCIRETKSHPSAEWVYQQLKPQIPDLSLGTVYRNLAMFKADGTIQSLGTVAGLERYDGNTDPHTHFICTTCGKVVDLENVELPRAVLTEAEHGAGGIIGSYQLQFFGSCADCAKQNH